MFKSKKIVALVLCAMMLFVPVAAAADALDQDFLSLYCQATLKAATAAADVQTKLGTNDNEGLRKAVKEAMVSGTTVRENQKKAEALDEAVKDYQKALKDAKAAVAKAESLKASVKNFKLDKDESGKFKEIDENALTVKDNPARTKDNATKVFTAANNKLDAAKEAIAVEEENFVSVNEGVKLAKALLPIFEKALVAGNDKNTAVATITALSPFYDEDQKAEIRALVAPQILKAWKVFVANASEYEKASFYSNLTDEVRELVDKADTKYEVMSTGEKGWILSDEAKNGCLQNVAEFKVEKKDGKFVAKVYDKDGKEMKIGQQLTVYRPIGKDVKVLKAKVDGKDVTFSVGLRNGQNYVSVPVIY